MLHTNPAGAPFEVAVFNPFRISDFDAAPITPVSAPCATTARLLALFEEITGWKAEFQETNSSLKRRQASGSKSEPPRGAFSIVDMSEHWPAQKPTCHRGKCDQFIALLDRFVGEHQSTEVELNRIQSALVALDTTAEIEDDVLVDSFVPKFRVVSNPGAEVAGLNDSVAPASSDDDFELYSCVSESSASLVCPPFDGWSLGGSTGIADNDYLDWMVDDEERIAICAGKIDMPTLMDAETVILVDPLTREYQISPSQHSCGDAGDSITFLLWDSKTHRLSVINPSADWQRLDPHQAIVATTAKSSQFIESWQSSTESHFKQMMAHESGASAPGLIETGSDRLGASKPVSTTELAEHLMETLGSADPLLVLMPN